MIKRKHNPHGGRYLSLKWKVLIVFSLVLLAVHGCLSGLSYYTLNQQLKHQRLEEQAQKIATARGLIHQSARRLQQIAETVPLLAEHATSNDNDKIIFTLDHYWRSLQLTWGLESTLYFSQEAELLGQWGLKTVTSKLPVQTVLNTEQPVDFIDCEGFCMQYVCIPILVGKESSGVLVISKTLADVIIDFQEATNADIGVLYSIRQDAPSLSKRQALWNRQIAAITHPQRSIKLLHKAAEHFSFQQLLDRGRRVKEDDQIYEIRLHPLDLTDLSLDPLLVILEEVTTTYANQQRNLLQNIYTGLFSLLISLILLVFLLRNPLRRLTRLASALPLLAKSAFNETRQALSPARRFPLGRDEIDHLENTALTLTDQLERLQQAIRNRTRLLTERSKELEAERNFVQELLDTAPLIILTQDASGKIITTNRQADEVLSGSEHNLIGHCFDDLFPQTEYQQENRPDLIRLRKGEIQRLQYDSQLSGERVNPCSITWFHSLLKADHPSDPVVLSIGLDITERKSAEDKLIWLADHDPLTNLFNRRRFQHEFERILGTAERYHRQGALLYFDLDQFKYINDTCGHKTGDILLQLIADTLRQVVRSSDLIARLGGDEFALVLPEADEEGAKQLAEKIFRNLQAIDFKMGNQTYKITVSIGIALFPSQGTTVQDLLTNADLAMYQAKEAGRGRIHVFSPDEAFHAQLKNRIYWKDQIEQALKEERFVLYFQAIMEVKGTKISHYETLLRMIGPRGEIIPPGDFIPTAEQVGLIDQIDQMVVKKAIAKHIKFREQGKNLTLSINLSGRALDNTKLQRIIRDFLNDPRVEPASLIFEITETTAVANFSSAQKLMREIKALGSSFAIDDFGVGFSSFYYLMHLPVDYVKIDGSFVRQLATSREDRILVRALAEIAQGLGKKTVAEYVENSEILDQLVQFGVDYAQGFYIGRPLPEICTDLAIATSSKAPLMQQ